MPGDSAGPSHAVRIAILGLSAGLLLAFGALILLFDLGESGRNTRPWQAAIGLVLPVVLLVLARRSARTARQPDQQRRRLGLWVCLGIALGVGGLILFMLR